MNAYEKCLFCVNNKDNGALYECKLNPSRKCSHFKKVSTKKVSKTINKKIENDYDNSVDNLNNILSNPVNF